MIGSIEARDAYCYADRLAELAQSGPDSERRVYTRALEARRAFTDSAGETELLAALAELPWPPTEACETVGRLDSMGGFENCVGSARPGR
jgi:hypothetical protein